MQSTSTELDGMSRDDAIRRIIETEMHLNNAMRYIADLQARTLMAESAAQALNEELSFVAQGGRTFAA